MAQKREMEKMILENILKKASFEKYHCHGVFTYDLLSTDIHEQS